MELKLGEKIKSLRKEKNISQEVLAQYLGVTFQAVSKWENGAALPDLTLIPAIALFFGVSTDQLCDINLMEVEKQVLRIRDEAVKYDACRILAETYKDMGSMNWQKRRWGRSVPGRRPAARPAPASGSNGSNNSPAVRNCEKGCLGTAKASFLRSAFSFAAASRCGEPPSPSFPEKSGACAGRR